MKETGQSASLKTSRMSVAQAKAAMLSASKMKGKIRSACGTVLSTTVTKSLAFTVNSSLRFKCSTSFRPYG
jgi:hypothetical protein